MIITIIIFILVLSLLVFVHELGHFWTARRFGVKAEEFGFGFPPRAIGWYRSQSGRWRTVWGRRPVEELENDPEENRRPAKKATVYSLNWLPLGGFVKIKGENGGEKGEKDSFAGQTIWRRTLILAAGVIMNIVLAWFLFSVGYLIGLPQSTDTLGKYARVSQPKVVVAEVNPQTPAEEAGLKSGDLILSVEGVEVGTEKALQDAIAVRGGQDTKLAVERGGKEMDISVKPKANDNGRAIIGINIFSAGLVSYPFFPAIWEGLRTTMLLLAQIFMALVYLLRDLFLGHSVSQQFAGPVGIATITGQAAQLGFSYLLQFVALLSLNLAIINILPFPALDGGRILFLAAEKIKGRPVKREVENIIHNIGFLLLIVLVLFITYRDIIKLF